MQEKIEGVVLIDSPVHEDSRGFFKEIVRLSGIKNIQQEFNIKQVNHSRSAKNTLRGIHVASWNKIVYIPRGRVQCVIVDCRKESRTFGKYNSFILGKDNRSSLFVPTGCGNSYLVLSEDADYIYFVDQEWEAGKESQIKWNDADLNIDWLIKKNLSISDRDQGAKSFAEIYFEKNHIPL